MELFRVSRDVWGREMIQGMSWDLLWLFVGVGAVFIVLHALYRAFFARSPVRYTGDPEDRLAAGPRARPS